MTAQSLLGRFGGTACSAAKTLIADNLAHFIASDAHDATDRTPALDGARDFVIRHYGEETARRLLIENPRAVISGEAITPAAPHRPRHWWQF